MVIPQVLGAALLIGVGWPASIPVMGDAPIWFMRVWIGAAFAMPIGFVLGLLLQRASGSSAPRSLIFNGAVCAVLMPIVAAAIVSI